jgi:hypothetical protein
MFGSHIRPPSPPDKALRAMEEEFTVDMDRDASEAALRGKSSGAYLLRPKDSNAFVISVNTGGLVVTHHVILRVAGKYQNEAVGEGKSFSALTEILDALRGKFMLSNMTFYEIAGDSSEEPTPAPVPPPAEPAPPAPVSASPSLTTPPIAESATIPPVLASVQPEAPLLAPFPAPATSAEDDDADTERVCMDCV